VLVRSELARSRIAVRISSAVCSLALFCFTAVATVAAQEQPSLAKYDAYLGDYQLGPFLVVSITHEGNQMFAQAGDQPFMELAPESDTKFVVKNIAGIGISFVKDSAGTVTSAIIHQGITNTPAPRLTASQAKELRDALAKRLEDQTPAPGTAEALRLLIESVQKGQPSYDMMTAPIAATVHLVAAQTQASLQKLGAVKSIAFIRIAGNGGDLYEVVYENGAMQYLIGLMPDGKVALLQSRPIDKPTNKPAAGASAQK
jgi:hypothetical protein